MVDREKVIKGLENCITGFDCPPECPYLDDCNDLMKPMFVELAKDAIALLKEQEETIDELQNAYGYLQKLFFETQDKLLKEQEETELCDRCGRRRMKSSREVK